MKKINMELAREKGLIANQNFDVYNEITKAYKYVLEYYLNSVIDLKKYDEEIKKSNLYIGMNKKYKQLNSYLDLNYIFLLNRLFIEKLDKKDIDLLKNSFNKNKISDELISMVKRTFKNVIYDNYLDGQYVEKVYKVCYGAFVPLNFVDNDSLILKIYYGRNEKKILDTKEFIALDKRQVDFFSELINELKKDIITKLKIKCDVLIEKDIN